MLRLTIVGTQAAGDAIANATRKGVGREMELGQELEFLKKAKASDKSAMQVIERLRPWLS